MSRIREALCLSALAAVSSGCLLLADPPAFTDDCVDQSVGRAMGPRVVANDSIDNGNAYDCLGFNSPVPDRVVEWTALLAGTYQIRVIGDGMTTRMGITSPACGTMIEQCFLEDQDGIEYVAAAGETIHIVVEATGDSVGTFDLSILPIAPAPSGGASPDDDDDDEECPYTFDGQCDEPQGTDVCPAGTDEYDCSQEEEPEPCPYTYDGECDEPEGTGVCEEGTDQADCDCPYQDDGECDEPEGTGYCADGSDPQDCW